MDNKYRFIIYFILGFFIMTIIGCEDTLYLEPIDESVIETEEPRVDVYYFDKHIDLDIDDNGYYHLDIDMNNWQTLQRLTGFISDSATSGPVVNCRVEWSSSHYWTLGDTLGYFIRRGLTDDLVYVNVDTSYVIGFDGQEVPTINPASYSNSDGEVNTMIAPIQTMVGDTMTIWYSWSGWYAGVNTDSLKIVLD